MLNNESQPAPKEGTASSSAPLHLKLLVTIVDRGKGQTAVSLLQKEELLFHRIVLGRGTAKTEMLDLLGIGDPAKDLVFSVLPSHRSRRAMHRLENTLRFDNPGHGIAFTLPISGVASKRGIKHLCGSQEGEDSACHKEDPMETRHYDLIIANVDKGFADAVMDAARGAGARGGTVIHARDAGVKEAEKFFGITLQPEKEMVFILVHSEEKRAIMEAIHGEICANEAGHGVVFSLPAGDVTGVVRMIREE